ncbi:MAG: response regulator [Ferruginibacter sp.]
MAKKILVIDDEPDMIKMVAGRLAKAGYLVIQAVNGKMGLDLLPIEKPDMVLLDLAMPGLDGEAVCRAIKADNATKNLPVMLFTASTARPLSDRAREMGADDYISKPFDAKELMGKIKKLLGE